MLTVEQFAVRMQMGETTVWNMISDGTFQERRHFWRPNKENSKIIRFPWGPELISNLMTDGISGLAAGGEEDCSGALSPSPRLGKSEVSACVPGSMAADEPCPPGKARVKKTSGGVFPEPPDKANQIAGHHSNKAKRRSFGQCPINPSLLKK